MTTDGADQSSGDNRPHVVWDPDLDALELPMLKVTPGHAESILSGPSAPFVRADLDWQVEPGDYCVLQLYDGPVVGMAEVARYDHLPIRDIVGVELADYGEYDDAESLMDDLATSYAPDEIGAETQLAVLRLGDARGRLPDADPEPAPSVLDTLTDTHTGDVVSLETAAGDSFTAEVSYSEYISATRSFETAYLDLGFQTETDHVTEGPLPNSALSVTAQWNPETDPTLTLENWAPTAEGDHIYTPLGTIQNAERLTTVDRTSR